MLAGSPGFQSPEQLRSESTGPPSDVYAFGALAVVLYKRCPLWPGLYYYQIMNKVTSNVYPSTDGVPAVLAVLPCPGQKYTKFFKNLLYFCNSIAS